MIEYDRRFDPPAPVVQVTVRHILQQRRRVTTAALLDTGSDVTAIPASLVQRLQLIPFSRLRLEDVSGETRTVLTYAVHLTIGELTLPRLEVIQTGLNQAIVGRDVLNHLYVLLSGPELAFSLSATSPLDQ
ncbi:MAG: retropepsin-like aspartic protease [Anaerolineae bacterium]